MQNTSVIGLGLAAATSILNVLMDVARKKAVARDDVIRANFWMRSAAMLIFTVAFLVHLHSPHGPLLRQSGLIFGLFGAAWPPFAKFFTYLLLDTVLVALGLFFYIRALQVADLSLCVPFLSFTPILLIPTGYLFLREIPTEPQFVGVVLIVAGLLAMNQPVLKRGILASVRAIFQDPGSRYILFVAIIFAITNPIDKVIVLMSDSITYAFGYGVMIWLFYGLLTLWKRGSLSRDIDVAPRWILLAGFLDASVLLLQFSSHRYIDVFITIAIKRAGVILSILAGWLIFKESRIRDRLTASIVMLGGVICIYWRPGLVVQGSILAGLGIVWTLNMYLHRIRRPVPALQSPTSPQRIVRCAILGCGEIAQQYIQVYRDLPWVRVAACIDIDLDSAVATAQYFAASQPDERTRAAVELSAALADDIDLVVISTPNHLHRDHAVAALQQGKHIFLQKPLASTMQDGRAIVEAARGRTACSGLYMSYFDQPVFHDLRSMTAAGCFGRITQIHARLMHPGGMIWSARALKGESLWRGSVERTGGGAFIQLAIHSIRTACWILQQRVVAVQGFSANLLCPGLEGEDTAVAILRFNSGVVATLNVSWCTGGEEFTLQGSGGRAVYAENRRLTVLSAQDFGGIVSRCEAGVELVQDCPRVDLGNACQPFNQHRLFLEAVRDGLPPAVSLDDGLQDLAVVDAFYESVRTGRVCEIAQSATTES